MSINIISTVLCHITHCNLVVNDVSEEPVVSNLSADANIRREENCHSSTSVDI
jgi:hypothetical protein